MRTHPGGEKMNHPPPSDRTHTPGVRPCPEFWILTTGFSPKCKTNPKRIARPRRASTYITPRFPPAGYPSLPRSIANYPKMRNEPNKDNARCNRATPIFNPHGSGGYAHDPRNTKRTQFTPGPPTKNAKQTQFTSPAAIPLASPCPKNAKQTQKDNARCNRAAAIFNPPGRGGYAHDQKMQNKPNLSRGGPVEDQNTRNKPNLPPRPASHFLLSPIYFRLSRGQQPAPPNLPPAPQSTTQLRQTNPIPINQP